MRDPRSFVCGKGLGAQQTRKTPVPQMIRLAICNEVWRDRPIEQVFETACAMGYEGVELAPFTLAESVDAISARRRREIRAAAELAGVEIVGLHWLFVSPEGLHLTTNDDAIWRRSVDYLKALAHFCGDLGGSVMIFGSPNARNVASGQSFKGAWTRACDALREAGQVAQERDVYLCFEALPAQNTNFVNEAVQAVELIEQVAHPNVAMMLDVKAASEMADGIVGTIARFGSVARHVHANDPSGRGPGMDGIDFGPVMAAVRDSGYQGWVSVEPFDYQPDPDTVARTAIETLRAAMENDDG